MPIDNLEKSANPHPEDALTPAVKVQTMQEVRQSIDTLDAAIVNLLAKRMRYIEAAARIKPSRDAVRDEWRVNDVLSKVKSASEKVDFPPELVEEVYRVLVEGSIQHEFQNWDVIEKHGAGHGEHKRY